MALRGEGWTATSIPLFVSEALPRSIDKLSPPMIYSTTGILFDRMNRIDRREEHLSDAHKRRYYGVFRPDHPVHPV
jgi:hypothetical protein